jgi:hypothetical protein
MAETTVVTPYASAMPWISAELVGWTDEYDAQRLASYDLYDDLYNNASAGYTKMSRGTQDKPIYVPTAKRIINTLARYVGKGWGYVVQGNETLEGDPNAQEAATPEQIALARATMGALFRRERILSKFASGKKEWLRRGDWVWYISADPEKAPGRRLTVRCVDPRMYFPIVDEEDPSRISGAQLIEEVLLDDGESFGMKVQRWIKPNHPEHPDFDQAESEEAPPIYRDIIIYDVEDFADEEKRKTLQTVLPLEALDGITSLPLYHLVNNEETDNPFGSSDLRGLESIVAGINQSISDEDLALAMSGLGMYVTNAAPPEGGAWILGPQMVQQTANDEKFERLEGITSVTPFQDHVGYLGDQALSANGISDVAMGTVDGATQVSGLALAIRLQPILDAAEEKDDQLNSIMTQMFYDLKSWFLAYEEIDLGPVDIISVVSEGERLPFDREARWKELMEGLLAKVFTIDFVVQELSDKFGYEFPAEMLGQLKAAAGAEESEDPYADRINAENNDEQ